MYHVTVDFAKETGRIRPMHCVNNGPSCHNATVHGTSNFELYRELGIPYARNHDASFYARYGGSHTVDVHAVFPDFNADPTDPASYDFTCTDEYIKCTEDAGTHHFYRLGSRIEHEVKKYGTRVPPDFQKWAVICEHIIRHYTQGWADGYFYDMPYWEIWNEPDLDPDDATNKRTWGGTEALFHDMYEIAAKHLKACFPNLKIGGPALCGNMEWGERFLREMQKREVPMDFFSWHSYAGVSNTVVMERFIEKHLEENGYGDVEIHVNEWNNASTLEFRGTSYACATACEMMIRMHHTKCYMMNYYDARLGPSVYGGMFNPMDHKPLCMYYGFKAIGELYAMENEVECECDGNSVCLAAVNGDKKGIVLVNVHDDEIVECALEGMKVYLVDQDHMMEEIAFNGKSVEIKKNQILFITN